MAEGTGYDAMRDESEIQRRWRVIHAERDAEWRRWWNDGPRERYSAYRRRREQDDYDAGWRWVPDPSFAPGAKRKVFEPGGERKEVRTVREVMEAAALADAGLPQSLIVRPVRRGERG